MGKFKNPYTPEQVIAFSYSQLVDMKEKATRNQVFDLLDLVNSELEKRPPPPPPKPVKSSLVRKLEKEVCNKMEKLGRRLLDIYDLSPTTAKKLSEGTKRFKAHSLLSKSGGAKTGGAQKNGLVAFDRYISYRLKDDVFALISIIYHDRDIDTVRYQVFAPESTIDNFVHISELREHLEKDEEIGLSKGGVEFKTFEEAEQLFVSLIDRFAPKLINQP
jgi:hypothetical protein